MFSFLRNLFAPRLYPMNVIRINKKNILRNMEYLQNLQSDSVLFPVLKSNAYGHWIKETVKILNNIDMPYFVVDSYPEYQIVKKYSNKKILIIWETLPDNYSKFDLKTTTFVVYNMETIKALGEFKKQVTIHLFFNTGMNREGIDMDQLTQVMDVLKQQKNIYLEWVMSHLYGADEIGNLENPSEFDNSNTWDKQIEIFKKMYYKILEYWYAPIYRHIWNSAGILKIRDWFFNSYRPGLALYWYNPLSKEDPFYEFGKKLLPALSVWSRVISKHLVWPGDGVSYNHKYQVKDREISCTVPFGYAEWLSRLASEKISFVIWKKTYKQIWIICMNLCSFLWDEKLEIGDEIQLISEKKDSPNDLYKLAESSQTIVYECLVRLDKGIRREVI